MIIGTNSVPDSTVPTTKHIHIEVPNDLIIYSNTGIAPSVAELQKGELQIDGSTNTIYANSETGIFSLDVNKLNTLVNNSTSYIITNDINDTQAFTNKVYSSSKVQSLFDAQSNAISNLSTASISFFDNTVQNIPFSDQPIADLDFDISQSTTNANVLDSSGNSIIIKYNGTYNFLNTLTFSQNVVPSNINITFNIYDANTLAILQTYTQPLNIAMGTSETLSMNATLIISGLTSPKTIKVNMKCDRLSSTNPGSIVSINSFNSIMYLSAVSSDATVDIINSSLGSLITETIL